MITTVLVRRLLVSCLSASLAGLAMTLGAWAQNGTVGDLSLELVDPNAFRVCADPGNMPFSNQAEEGFENRIAELFAERLGKELTYTWYPQATGFVRNTLGAHRCDVIIGFAQGHELVQNTNPYYHTAYALLVKPGSDLEGVETLSDPRLKGKRIGVVAGTPPSSHMVRYGLIADAKPYPLMVDTRVDSSARDMMADLAAGEIDAGILWGPLAGYFAKRTDPPTIVVPLLKEEDAPRLTYHITMGVRASDQEWKRTLNRMIEENRPAIEEILIGYGVPLLDEHNQLIGEQ